MIDCLNIIQTYNLNTEQKDINNSCISLNLTPTSYVTNHLNTDKEISTITVEDIDNNFITLLSNIPKENKTLLIKYIGTSSSIILEKVLKIMSLNYIHNLEVDNKTLSILQYLNTDYINSLNVVLKEKFVQDKLNIKLNYFYLTEPVYSIDEIQNIYHSIIAERYHFIIDKNTITEDEVLELQKYNIFIKLYDYYDKNRIIFNNSVYQPNTDYDILSQKLLTSNILKIYV